MFYLFNQTGLSSDSKRHFGTNISLYWETKISTYAAAQFIVSKRAILQNSLPWWVRLYEISSHMPIFEQCQRERRGPPRTWSEGSIFTQILERVWHTIFRGDNNNRPFEMQARINDTSLPKYLRVK